MRRLLTKRTLMIAVTFVLAVLVAGFVAACRAKPGDLGILEGALRPCPDSPNCVSTSADDDRHAIPPLRFTGDAAAALDRLAALIEETPRARVAERSGLYVRAEFTSLVFRFVDDVEFLADEAAGRIDFRSLSRVGYSDFGANRRRMERLRERFDASGGDDVGGEGGSDDARASAPAGQ